MKITLIRRRWSATGGAENYLLRLAKQLQQRGHEASLICEKWDQRQQDCFREVIELPIKASRARQPMEFANQANHFLENHEADCVLSLERGIHAEIYRAGDGVHRAWLHQRKKFRPVRGRFQNLLNPKNRILCKLEKFTFNPAHISRVIANSEMVKKNILEYFKYPPENIHVIPNGVDIEYFSSGNRAEGRVALQADENDFVILLVGAGKERKGHDFARQVARRLGKKAKLAIVAKPQFCPMPSIYAAADIFLLPTLYDPSANVILEAMAAGLPVITTTDNGASEVIQHRVNGFVVPSAKNVTQMTEIAQNLVQNHQFREQISAAARQTASEFSLEKNVSATIALCEAI